MINNTKKLNKKYNKNILLASDCTKNKILPKYLNKIINYKFKNLEHIKISVVITPKLGFKNRSYSYKKNRAIKKFKKQEKKLNIEKSYAIEYVDFSFKKNLDKCINSLKTSNIIWIVGGDTFYLWYHLKKNKIDKIINNRIKKNNVLYVGCCAGAIIAGETLNPTYIARLYKKSNKYNLKNIYKYDFWNNIKNKKTLKLAKNKDFLPHCKSKKSKQLNMYNNKTKMFCLPEYKPFTRKL